MTNHPQKTAPQTEAEYLASFDEHPVSSSHVGDVKWELPERQLEALRLDGVDLTPENTPEVQALREHPQLVGQYEVIRLIGRGAQGSVYMARQIATNRIVAVKALAFDAMMDWKSNELFEREVALLKSMRIDGTPQFIEDIDATRGAKPCRFLVQEYIPGTSLQAMLDAGATFSPKDVIDIALAIIPILKRLREYVPPIVHRDIKPSNIMCTPQGDIYLVDFGAAMYNERCMGGSTFAGTAGYMAPEQCLGKSCPESDVYSLGATLIHLLIGIAPYELPVESMRLQFKNHIPPSTPRWFVQILETMVSPFPNERLDKLNHIELTLRTKGAYLPEELKDKPIRRFEGFGNFLAGKLYWMIGIFATFGIAYFFHMFVLDDGTSLYPLWIALGLAGFLLLRTLLVSIFYFFKAKT